MSENGQTLSETVLFAEKDQAMAHISALTGSETNAAGILEERNTALASLRRIYDKYLECPTLLDKHVEPMVSALVERARKDLSKYDRGSETAQYDSSLSYVLSAIYALSKVRGRKRIQQFLPHEVSDIEPVLTALERFDAQGRNDDKASAPTIPQDEPQAWESIYTLWNWLGILSLVPFDCCVLMETARVQSLIALAKQHLLHSGPSRDMAASCLASWLSRPDLRTDLEQFVEWGKSVLEMYSSATNRGSPKELFRVLGIFQTLATTIKVSTENRSSLIATMVRLWDPILVISESNPTNHILRKLLVKWWSRMGCAFLPSRVAPWRYQRGRRSLAENIRVVKEDATRRQEADKNGETIEKDIFYVPDQVEEAMGQVIEALTDSSTAVRWTAAKGVGRITQRLPSICAHDVLDAVVELCEDSEKDHAWHGACLALAELARRGLLLPDWLNQVVPLVVRAIHYDVRRGQTSVGAHVRDAACYTYWAFARAYAPTVLKPFLPDLSRSIVLCFLFDREVNCRRAASAAFQECVGRQGADNFKHGIDILTKADYFSLGNRKDSFTSIACYVAGFEQYRRPIIEHLYQTKLPHWDIEIRSLASKSLYDLTVLEPGFVSGTVVPSLLKTCLDERNLSLRHGSVLGLSEIIRALGDTKLLEETLGSAENSKPSPLDVIAELVATIEKKRLYRGRGGEIMRSAVCRLIECISLAKVPLTVRQQVRLLDSIDANLPHPSEKIQEDACLALKALMNTYFPVGPKGPSERLQKRVVDKYTKNVKTSGNPAVTRGFALALGYLPRKLLAPSRSVLDSVILCLSNACHYDARVGAEGDAETRRNALVALSKISVTVGKSDDSAKVTCVSLCQEQAGQIYEAFFLALRDYKTDRRGDVGSWCRLAAMDGLEAFTYVSCNNTLLFDAGTCTRMIGALLKQACEKLDAVRSHAFGCLERLLTKSDPEIPYVPERVLLTKALELEAVAGSSDGVLRHINWADSSRTFPMVIKLMDSDVFFADILAGLIVSVGGLTASVSKESTAALVQWVKKAKGSKRIHELGTVLLQIFKRHQREGRVILPLLKTIDILVSRLCLDELIKGSNNGTFLRELLECLSREEKNCRDVHRLHAMVDVSLGMLSIAPEGKTSNQILRLLSTLLGHRYPRVRLYTAENLYALVIEDPDRFSREGAICKKSIDLENLLMETSWGSDLDTSQVKERVDQVKLCLGINEGGH